ncbi:MAG: tetratricopeptide repeat protein [Planctomycetes bacterium]|nr:tetratricopeptide repeat protein [Planctomycetota bacterium]
MRVRFPILAVMFASVVTAVGGCMAQERSPYRKSLDSEVRSENGMVDWQRPVATIEPARAELPLERQAAQPISDEDRRAFEAAVALAAELKYADAAQAFARLVPRLEAVAAWPQAAESMFWLGYCREKLGNAEEAVKAYRRLQEVYPRAPAAKQAETRMELLKPTPQEKTPE